MSQSARQLLSRSLNLSLCLLAGLSLYKCHFEWRFKYNFPHFSPMSTEYAASYPGDMDPSSRGDIVIRQNQMLPIYCSIMGMIIISLLLYVIYKLWKQREAMASAKLSEVFANGTGNGLDKALIRTSNTPNTTTTTITTTASAAPSLGLNSTVVTITEAQTTGSPEGTYDPTHHRTQSISSETRSHGKRSDHKVPDSHTDGGMSEKHPLITGAHNSLTDQGELNSINESVNPCFKYVPMLLVYRSLRDSARLSLNRWIRRYPKSTVGYLSTIRRN